MLRRLLFAGGFIIGGSALTSTYIKWKPAFIALRFNIKDYDDDGVETTIGEMQMIYAIKKKDQVRLEKIVNDIKYYEAHVKNLPNWLKNRVQYPIYDFDRLLTYTIFYKNLPASEFLQQKTCWELETNSKKKPPPEPRYGLEISGDRMDY